MVAGETSCRASLSPVSSEFAKPADLPLFGKGADQVVALETLHFQVADIHRSEDALDQLKLGPQLRRRSLAVGLVGLVVAIAESDPALVKTDYHVIRLFLADDPQEHGGKTVGRIGKNPRRIGQGRQGIKSPVDQAAAVNDQKFFHQV